MRWIFAVTVLLKRKYPCIRPMAEHLEGQSVAPEAERGWQGVGGGCSRVLDAHTCRMH